MKTNLITKISLFGIAMFGLSANAQTTLELDATKSIAKIQPTMYGIFFEDINFAADGGLYAEMIKNRSFEFADPLMGWLQPNTDRHKFNNESGVAITVKNTDVKTNQNFLRATVKNDKGYELINEGFRGMGIKKDAKYNLSLKVANADGGIKKSSSNSSTRTKKFSVKLALMSILKIGKTIRHNLRHRRPRPKQI